MTALNRFNTFFSAAKGFYLLPVTRQVGLLLGLSASIALGFWIVLWTKDSNYRPIYNFLSPQEVSDILDALQEKNIPYKLDTKTNSILVPENDVYAARLQTASHGLPKSGGNGFEVLDKEQGIVSSRFMETARYKYALEGELSRTISSLENIKNVRVHLALPKESVFVNDNKKASASVVLELASGATLNKKQVLAIMQLVASSIPNMQQSEVSVIDQHGHLLSYDISGDQFSMTREQFEYTNQIDHDYEKRIETMLAPLLGENSLRVRVNADIDFNQIEQTQESFKNDAPVVRSEQVISEENSKPGSGAPQASGIPGTLSNQPPQPTTMNQQSQTAQQKNSASAQPTATEAPVDNSAASAVPAIKKRNETRNYELGKVISHSRIASGNVKRLSVAVVVDNKQVVDPKTGKVASVPLTKPELDNIISLVQNAVGYNADRGDKISVVNIPFIQEKIQAVNTQTPWWEQLWFLNLLRMGGAGALLLVILLMVLRPTLRILAAKSPHVSLPSAVIPASETHLAIPAGLTADLKEDKISLSHTPATSEEGWAVVKKMALDDPRRMAQVMKSWIGDESNG